MSDEQNKRKATDLEKETFEYLNGLRSSGVVNMFGAAPYVEEAMGVKKQAARKLVMLWSKNFNNEGDYDEIVDADNSPITWEKAEVPVQ